MGEPGTNSKMDRKLPRGVNIRGNVIWITFTYKGVTCRESLRIPATKKNLEYAKELLKSIKFNISIGRFDYPLQFPDSTNLKKLGLANSVKQGETIEQRLIPFLERNDKDRVSASTYRSYINSAKGVIIPAFGDLLVSELRPSHIKAWVKKAAKEKTRKTIANNLIPLRNMYQEIEEDYEIPNPVKKVDLSKYFTAKNRAERQTEERNDYDPFSDKEMTALLNAMAGQHYNLIYFAFWTGLRTGELIALRWEKIDWVHKTALIDRSSTIGVESSTKTGEKRHIDLLPPALDALNKQLKFTEGKEHVFHDPAKDEPWQNDQAIRKKAWHPYFTTSGVRYRKPYQTRHTFATRMLLAGEAEQWVMRMLGHRTLEMLRRNYGHLLPDSKERSNYTTRNDWNKSVDNEPTLKVVSIGEKQ